MDELFEYFRIFLWYDHNRFIQLLLSNKFISIIFSVKIKFILLLFVISMINDMVCHLYKALSVDVFVSTDQALISVCSSQ